ncbi:MAG TPA: hypothetical protein VM165_10740 [Planctomycetaceae bacterium]|nr:hypothetical protein [Planctomycetaceae bacterium]
MPRCVVHLGLLAAACLMSPLWASAQVVGDDSAGGWRTSQPRWGFFNISRRMQAQPYEDDWMPRDPAMGGDPTFAQPFGEPDQWDAGPWSTPGMMGDCCQPACDPCGDCCQGSVDGQLAPSVLSPGTPRAIPIPTPLDRGAPGPEYVPRNKVPTPIETPDDPNWHKIPDVPKASPKAAPEPAELPTDIPIPAASMPDKESRRPTMPRTSSRFVPVPSPSAARVWALRADPALR